MEAPLTTFSHDPPYLLMHTPYSSAGLTTEYDLALELMEELCKRDVPLLLFRLEDK